MRLLKLMKDHVAVEMGRAIRSVVEIVAGMTRNPAKTRRPKPRLHPRRHRRLRMRRHLRALLTGLSVRCQHASFGPLCLTALRNE